MPESSQGSSGGVLPYPLAMLICDFVYRDPYTGKETLIGIFSELAGTSYPLVHPVFCVYVALTDGYGKPPFRLQLVDADELRKPIFEIENDVEFMDPRTIASLQFELRNVVIPEPGEYRLQLFISNQFLIERRILAIRSNDLEDKT